MPDVHCVRLRVADTTTPRSLTLFAYLYIELLCLAIGGVFLCFCGFNKFCTLLKSQGRMFSVVPFWWIIQLVSAPDSLIGD